MQREMIIGKNHMKGTFTFVNGGEQSHIQELVPSYVMEYKNIIKDFK